jgi:deoxyribonuclease-4
MVFYTNMTRKVGAHIGGVENFAAGVRKAAAMGCTAMQLFSGSPRIWQRRTLTSIVTPEFLETREKLAINPVITHALYLVNLASDKAENVEKSATSLRYELEFDAAIGGGGVVVHVGSHQGRGWESARHQVVQVIGELLAVTPENSCFLIENAAGQNGKVGDDLREIQEILERLEAAQKYVSRGRVGWCFDTCHAHAAGYYLGTVAPDLTFTGKSEKDMKNAHRRGALSARETITALGLWDVLKCVHVNDSKDPFGSGRDRHQNLGDGLIPQEDMQSFLRLPELSDAVPLILEVPGIDDEGPDAENVSRLKKLLG